MIDEERLAELMNQSQKIWHEEILELTGGPGPIYDFAVALEAITTDASIEFQMPRLLQAASLMDIKSHFRADRSVWSFACLSSQMRALLRLGCPIDLTDKFAPDLPALTPLALSILRCETDAVELLISHGADPLFRVGNFLAFELCEPEALNVFGMTESTHPECQIEMRALLLPIRERFLLSASTPGALLTLKNDTRRL